MTLRLLLCFLVAHTAHAEPVVMIADATGAGVTEAGAALVADGHAVSVVVLKDAAPALLRTDATLLAAGPRSCDALARALSPRKACIATEVPLSVQMALLSRAFPGRSRVIVLRDPARTASDDALQAAARDAGLSVLIVDVRAPGEAVPAFVSALRAPGTAAILLALPDKSAFTADTVAPLSQAALSARVPLVGFSPYFLKVGAVGAMTVDIGGAARGALHSAAHGASNDSASAKGAGNSAAAASRLVIDGRLAQRLGIPVKAAAGVEVRR